MIYTFCALCSLHSSSNSACNSIEGYKSGCVVESSDFVVKSTLKRFNIIEVDRIDIYHASINKYEKKILLTYKHIAKDDTIDLWMIRALSLHLIFDGVVRSRK